MKKIFSISILAIILIFALLFTGCTEIPNSEVDDFVPPYYENKEETVDIVEVLHILKTTANDFAGIEYEKKLDEQDIIVKPFLEVNQEELIKEMTIADIEKNIVISDARTSFIKAVNSTIKIIESYKDFKFGKTYNVREEGNITDSYCPVNVSKAEDGGLFLLVYDDSVIKNNVSQTTFYLNIINGHSVVHSSSVYTSSPEGSEKAMIFVDYMEFISNVKYETASMTMEIDNPLDVRKIAKILNKDSESLKELKQNIKYIEYGYSSFGNNVWNSLAVSYDTSDTEWTPFMNKILSSMKRSIDEYGADFEYIFKNNTVTIVIHSIVKEEETTDTTETEGIVESENNVQESESETEIIKNEPEPLG